MKKKRLSELKSAVSDVFELPKDIMLNLPKITMIGDGQMVIENHRGVIEYTPERARINSTIGVIRITGEHMNLKNIAEDDIFVSGKIKIVEFLNI